MNASDSRWQSDSGRRTWRLAVKELREILRDRRTVLTLVLMPLLVYPLLGVMMRKGLMSGLSQMQTLTAVVCLEDEQAVQIFSNQVLRGSRLLKVQDPDAAVPFQLDDDDDQQQPLEFTAPGSERPLKYHLYHLQESVDTESEPADPAASERKNLEQQITEGFADLAIRVIPDDARNLTNTGRVPFVEWQMILADGSALGKRAASEVTACLEALNDEHLTQLLQQHGVNSDRPASIQRTVLEPSGTATSPLITFIPLVLVLMTMTGAVYPAIDLTAGERERGTMEILVAAPVSRMTLLAGKFVAVLTVALLTASVNLFSMFATLFALGLEGTVLGHVNITMIVQVVVLMIVFAAFFSAVLLSITSVARSFKEAQAYLIPLMLMALTPGVFSLMPDLKVNGLLAVTPLVNTVLLGRDLLLGDVNLVMLAIVLISTTLYGVLALSVAAQVFGSDSVLYGSGGSWADFFKRPAQPAQVAPLTVALSCLAIVFSLFIVVGSLPSRIQSSLTVQLLASGCVSILLFVIIPILVARVAAVRVLSGFAVRRAAVSAWIAAALLGSALWVFVYELEVLMLSEDRIEFLKQLYESFQLNLQAVPLWVKLFALAVAPAACEEFFFRGMLQQSIRKRSTATLAIVSSAVLFGLFHVIVKDALLFERLLPSTLMGLILGIVFERSGSVLPGMLLHVIHNGFLVTVSQYEEQLAASGIGVAEHQHLPAMWLLYAAVPIVVAAVLLWKTDANRRSIAP